MAREIWQKVEERNNTVEKTTQWINSAYKEIKIKALADIPKYRYTYYKKFLDAKKIYMIGHNMSPAKFKDYKRSLEDSKVYIIIHPAFYTFFHHPKIIRKDNSLDKNIVDLLLEGDNASEMNPSISAAPYNAEVVETMKEFERIGRNFLEFMSTEQKLIILVLPSDYKSYPNYRYKNGTDEFLRYINNVTNASESVLYIKSRSPDRGQLLWEDLDTLVNFLQMIEVGTVLIGGQYVGRCEEDFYKHLFEMVGNMLKIELIPELSPPSPDDMNAGMKKMLDKDDRLDVKAVTFNILNNRYENLEAIITFRNLKSNIYYEKP